MTGSDPQCRPVLPPIDAWPAALRAAWLTAAEPTSDLFGSPSRASTWRSSTRLQIGKSFSKLLSTIPPDQVCDTDGATELVTRENLKQLVRHMMDADLALSTQATCLLNISLGASAMAPNIDWNWVRRAAKTLQNRARQAVPASIPVSTATLLVTAKRLFRQAWADGAATRISPAVRARDSLIMGCLAMRPLRRANLSGLRLGEHVFPEVGRIRLLIPASEMKMGKRSYAADWPDALAAELTVYLDHIRPLLVRCHSPGYEPACDSLWVSRFGTALSAVAIHKQVSVITAAHFGAPITLHRFRTIAATTLADESPEDIHLATEVLGHADVRSRDYYFRASGLIAARRSHESEDRQLRAAPVRTRRETVQSIANSAPPR